MSKPQDTWKHGDPRQSLNQWPHAMTRSKVEIRFNDDAVTEFRSALNEIVGQAGKRNQIAIMGCLTSLRCPECGSEMRLHRVTLGNGSEAYWPQCVSYPTHSDHGYGSFSRHGKVGQPGRAPGSTNRPRAPRAYEPAPAPAPAPEPLPLPVVPGIPAGMIYHERLPDILALYRAGMRAFLLEGPAGSGKTSLGESLSKVLGHGCVTVSGCRDTEKSEITKGAHPVTGVERLSPFMRALCEGPTVGTIDEGDGIPPDVMLGLNQPSANRCLFVNGERRELHPDSVIIITANATNGASRTYTGRYPMDGATKSRFFPVFCDYSNNIEQTICPDVSIRAVVAGVRARVNNDPRLAKDFGAVVGTRLLIQASITGRAYGLSGEQAVSKVFELGYPADVARQLMGR